MDKNLIVIGIFILCLSVVIFVIKNFEYFLKWTEKHEKATKIIGMIAFVLINIAVVIFIIKQYKEIKVNIKDLAIEAQYKKEDDNDRQKIEDENKFYKEAVNKEYEKQNYKEPYIPEKFEHIEGEWNNGFVIQDEEGNQYTWIPCTNKENIEVEKLQRQNFSRRAIVSKDGCNNESYSDFINSALENGGFYVSRFEIGKENEKPVSKKEVEVWNNLTKEDAINIIKTMYPNESIRCELINGYAYDTIASWLKNNNEIKIDTSADKEKNYTGRNVYNNIYDFCDNVMELTQEENFGTIVVRGNMQEEFSKKMQESFNYDYANFDRFSIFEGEKNYKDTNSLSFRTVLYK